MRWTQDDPTVLDSDEFVVCMQPGFKATPFDPDETLVASVMEGLSTLLREISFQKSDYESCGHSHQCLLSLSVDQKLVLQRPFSCFLDKQAYGTDHVHLPDCYWDRAF